MQGNCKKLWLGRKIRLHGLLQGLQSFRTRSVQRVRVFDWVTNLSSRWGRSRFRQAEEERRITCDLGHRVNAGTPRSLLGLGPFSLLWKALVSAAGKSADKPQARRAATRKH